MDTGNEKKMQCTLCGAWFVPEENTCGGCAMRKDCELICCPNCGFGMPEESRLVKWLKKKTEQRSD